MTPAFKREILQRVTVADYKAAVPTDAWLVGRLSCTVVSTAQEGGPVLRWELLDRDGEVLMSFDTRQVNKGDSLIIGPVGMPFNLTQDPPMPT